MYMEYENVKFGSECREKIIEGATLVADSVRTTYGPNGSNVAIKIGNRVKVTKDGATVASAVNDFDPYISTGIKLMLQLSMKTADDIGDGSSTAVILAKAIIDEFQDSTNPIKDMRELKAALSKIIEYMKPIVKSPYIDTLEEVATASANNDKYIGHMVAEAFDEVGKEGIVTFEETDNLEDSIEYSKGFQIENGFTSRGFINSPTGNCILEDCWVYIQETKVEYTKEQILHIADEAMKKSKSLLIIAPDFDPTIPVFLQKNKDLLKSCCVISPEHGDYRKILIEDIKAILGESSICKKVIITDKDTTFIGYESNDDLVTDKAEEIREILRTNQVTPIELDFHRRRLANFVAGLATIRIGGHSVVEIGEKKDRVEDAVRAVQAAIKGGIVPGGGLALLFANEMFYTPTEDALFGNGISERVKRIILTPLNIIGEFDETFWKTVIYRGHDKTSEDYRDDIKRVLSYEIKVFDPFLVVKTALENAISTATMILTCNCAIISDKL